MDLWVEVWEEGREVGGIEGRWEMENGKTGRGGRSTDGNGERERAGWVEGSE